jgi:hypothetical protein
MTEQRKSLSHTLATASALAVPISFAVTILMNVVLAVTPLPSRRIVSLVMSVLAGLIVISGLVAGVVALFGIPRHGKKGILWKSLFGVLVPVLLFLLALPAISAAKRLAEKNISVEARRNPLGQIAGKLNEQCPVMVDEVTRLDSVRTQGGSSLVFAYTLITMQKADFPDGEFESQMRPIVVEAYNTADDMKLYRDGRVMLINRYNDKDGVLVAEISVGPKDLKR